MKYEKLNKLELNNISSQIELDKNYVVDNFSGSKTLWIFRNFDKFPIKDFLLKEKNDIDTIYISENEVNENFYLLSQLRHLFESRSKIYVYRIFGKGSDLIGIKYILNSNELENPNIFHKVIGIAYHSADTDGLMSQYIIRKCINHIYHNNNNVKIIYIPYNYLEEDNQTLFESIFTVDELYILDFTPNKNIIDTIEYMIKVKQNFNVTIFDHHNSENLIYALERRNENIIIYYNIEKSACQLCWEYYSCLFCNDGKNKLLSSEYDNIKEFVYYFDYHDTWEYGTNAIHDLISQSLQYFFADNIFSIKNTSIQRILFDNYLDNTFGISIYSDKLYRIYSNIGIEYYLKASEEYNKQNFELIELGDYNLYFQEGKPSYFSWNKFLKTDKLSITFHYIIDGNNLKVSIRSNKSCKLVNAQKMARLFGGDGHEYAAGCTIKCIKEYLPCIIKDTFNKYFVV